MSINTLEYINEQGYISFAEDDYPLTQTSSDSGNTAPVNIKTGGSLTGTSGSLEVISGDAAVTSGSIYVQTGQALNGGQILINAQGTTPGPVNLQQNGVSRIGVDNTGAVAINSAASRAVAIRQNGADRIIIDVNGAIGLDPSTGHSIYVNSDGTNGVYFNNTAVVGYTPALLNYYETASLTLNFTGAFTVSCAANIERMGNRVAITIAPSGSFTAANAPATATAAGGAIPARFRLTGSNTYYSSAVIVNDNGNPTAGIITLDPNSGTLRVAPAYNSFTAAAGAGWGFNITLSYVLL